MKIKKQLGIWMDHSFAHLMEFKNNEIESDTIEAESFIRDDEAINWKNDSQFQSSEQNDRSHYFKQLTSVIQNYDEVLLFGPTDAKIELFGLIDSNELLDFIRITLKTVDKMTENQQHAFVRAFFSEQYVPSKTIMSKSFPIF